MTAILPFSPLQSSLDPSFWSALTELKIDVLKLSDEAVPLTGHYTTGKTVLNRETGEQVSLGCFATFQASSLSSSASDSNEGATLHGHLRNFNTIEDFRTFDKQAHFNGVVAEVKTRKCQSDVFLMLDQSYGNASPLKPS